MKWLIPLLIILPANASWMSEFDISNVKLDLTSISYSQKTRCLEANGLPDDGCCINIGNKDLRRLMVQSCQLVLDPTGDAAADVEDADLVTRDTKEVNRLNAIEACAKTKPADMTDLQDKQCTVSMAIQFMKARLLTGEL